MVVAEVGPGADEKDEVGNDDWGVDVVEDFGRLQYHHNHIESAKNLILPALSFHMQLH